MQIGTKQIRETEIRLMKFGMGEIRSTKIHSRITACEDWTERPPLIPNWQAFLQLRQMLRVRHGIQGT